MEAHKPLLQAFKTTSSVLGWIDVLDVQKMDERRLEKLFSRISTFSVRYSKMQFTQLPSLDPSIPGTRVPGIYLVLDHLHVVWHFSSC
jgi:hypothetical protein